MSPTNRDNAKGLVAAVAATGFVIAVMLSAPVHARHGGNVDAAETSATATNDVVVMQDASKPNRQEAALKTVMTDESPNTVESYEVKTLSTDYGQFFRSSR